MNKFKKQWQDLQIQKYQEMLDAVKDMVKDMDDDTTEVHPSDSTSKRESIHSAKWDSCVAEVGKDKSKNAPAICTARLGEESFKSEMSKSEIEQAKQEVSKALDVAAAGGIPNSLLARQDLESSTTKSTEVYLGYTIECHKVEDEEIYTTCGEAFESLESAKAYIRKVSTNTNKSNEKKSFVSTGKDLNEAIKAAEEATSTEEKEEVTEDIKNIQIERQNAEINARKSFKDVWKSLNKS